MSYDVECSLLDNISRMEVIDAHEHLQPEDARIAMPVDVFTLFSHYTHWDLLCAGMSEEEYSGLFDQGIPLAGRWRTFAPYWEKIRFTSYSRAALLAAERFYGASDIDESTYESISEAIKAANKSGLYRRVLREACNIRTCLNQLLRADDGTELLTPLIPMFGVFDSIDGAESLLHPPFDPNATLKSLDEYLDAFGRYILRVKSEGAVGLKIISNPWRESNRSEAASLFDDVTSGAISSDSPRFPRFRETNPLRDYVVDFAIKIAGEANLVVAVHAGYWGDFRDMDSVHMIPLLMRHPSVRFDIFHLGYPRVRETLMLGKGFPNVWLNFAWTHIISSSFAQDGLDEALDLLPNNKVLGFGGDYGVPVEKVYGHLTMARENIAHALAKRVRDGRMSESQALGVARKILWDNPRDLYDLSL